MKQRRNIFPQEVSIQAPFWMLSANVGHEIVNGKETFFSEISLDGVIVAKVVIGVPAAITATVWADNGEQPTHIIPVAVDVEDHLD